MKFAVPVLAAALVGSAVGADAWSLIRPSSVLSPTTVWTSPMSSLIRRQREEMLADLDRLTAGTGFNTKTTSPRYEITDTDEKFSVALDVPGVKEEDLSIKLEEEGHLLSISGHRESSGENYKFTSHFSQSFSLDPAVDLDKLTANLDDGVLVVSAPKDVKLLEDKVRNIPILTNKPQETIEGTKNVEIHHEKHVEPEKETVET